jgi:hypothetical protein
MKSEKHKIDPHLSDPKGRMKPADECESVLDGKANLAAANQNDRPSDEASGSANSPKRRGSRGTTRKEDAGL